jgi:hypothetical protein
MIKVEIFNVRIVKVGDRYGLNDCLVNRDRPMVEFYDTRQDPAKFGERGQFVSRYFVYSILEREENVGLSLLGYVPDWTVSAAGMREVIAYLRGWMEGSSQ